VERRGDGPKLIATNLARIAAGTGTDDVIG
jgi:hypothetical protein